MKKTNSAAEHTARRTSHLNIKREERTDTPVAMRPENHPEDHPDKRFRRTDRMLREALLEMLENRRLPDITTTELCRRADVSRNTFYAHYTAVEHLYDDMENDYIRELLAAFRIHDEHEENVASITRVLEVVQKHRQLAEALVSGKVISDFYRKVYPLVWEEYSRALPDKDLSDSHAATAFFLYTFQGTRAVINRWIADGMIEEPRAVAEWLVSAGEGVMHG